MVQAFGDEKLALVSLLLAHGELYIADRIRLQDRAGELMAFHSPLTGVLVSSHVDRWERGDLTTREVTTVANHPDPRHNLFCSGRLTYLMI